MSRFTPFILLPLAAFLLTPVAAASPKARARTFERSKRGFSRDVRRVQKVARVSSLTQLLGKKSAFSGRLSADTAWARTPGKDGRKAFTVDLGGGSKIEGASYHLNLPVAKVNKLLQLDVVTKSGKRVSLMPTSKRPVLLGADTSYDFINDKVYWHGPQSRFAILSLFHELGHVKDFGHMTEARKADFSQIYDATALEKRLTPEQHRKLVGFERSAWAHALHQARKLKRQGVDVFGGASPKEVMSTIYSCLKGYYEYTGKPTK